MNRIHPTSVVSEEAILGEENYIGPFCYIGPKVKIGNGNRLEAYVSVGTPAEHRTAECLGGVEIGDRNKINEFTTINSALEGLTTIASDCYIMRGCHLGHDARIHSNVTLSCNVIIGGHSIVQHSANLGLATSLHQKRVVGAYCMIGMGSVVTKNIHPFLKCYGNPAKPHGINEIGLKRSGVVDYDIRQILNWYYEGMKDTLDTAVIDEFKNLCEHVK